MLADAIFGLAGEEGTDLDFGDLLTDDFALLILTSGDDGISLIFGDHRVAWDKEDAGVRVHDIVHREAADETVLKWDDNRVTSGVDDATDLETMVAVAVFLTDDNVLGNVDETAGKIARVGGLKRGIRATLTGAVGVDEELRDLHTFAVGGDDWKLDFFVLRVGDEAFHTDELFDVIEVTTSTGVGHLDDWVALIVIEVFFDVVLDAFGDGGPNLNDLLMTFFVGEHTFAVKEVDVVDLLLSLFDLFVLAIDGVDVGDSDGDGGDGGVFEALVFDLIEDRGALLGAVLLEDLSDDRLQLLLLDWVKERLVGDVGLDIGAFWNEVFLKADGEVILVFLVDLVDPWEVIREDLVEDNLTDAGD